MNAQCVEQSLRNRSELFDWFGNLSEISIRSRMICFHLLLSMWALDTLCHIKHTNFWLNTIAVHILFLFVLFNVLLYKILLTNEVEGYAEMPIAPPSGPECLSLNLPKTQILSTAQHHRSNLFVRVPDVRPYPKVLRLVLKKKCYWRFSSPRLQAAQMKLSITKIATIRNFLRRHNICDLFY